MKIPMNRSKCKEVLSLAFRDYPVGMAFSANPRTSAVYIKTSKYNAILIAEDTYELLNFSDNAIIFPIKIHSWNTDIEFVTSSYITKGI